MRSIWQDKRAITPVLSNVLLIVIAVAGMSIAITATYVITGNLRGTMGERFIVEDVWFRPGILSIYLRNTGETATDFAAVYVNNRPLLFSSFHLEPQSHGWLNATFAWSTNVAYYINIVTSRGTQVGDYYKSPV